MPANATSRAGRYVKQPSGYRAFVPAPLPPDPPVDLDSEMVGLLEAANLALGRLDGIVQTVPDPDFFVAMYVRREAVLSSQIEGTQGTLEDLLAVELDPKAGGIPEDVGEIVNYIRAMNRGLDRLSELPLSLRLIREIHAELLQDGRGSDKAPGEFRKTQNWIGPAGSTLSSATYVPPPVPDMHQALDNLEKFLHLERGAPILIDVGLAHGQFETIHPFLDGNGRIGRLLIAFSLVQRGVLRKPVLYLSYFLKRHRSEYYERLNSIRAGGDWEGWLRFFLRGIAEAAEEASVTAERIFGLREEHRALALKHFGENGLGFVGLLFRRPHVNVALVAKELGLSFQTANVLAGRLQELGLLEEITGKKRGRVFRYAPYLDLFDEPPADAGADTTAA